jgi:acyl carrier protein
MTNTATRLDTIFTALFGEQAASLSDGDSMSTVAAWDSASQLDLIMAIEAEFDIFFDVADMPDLTNVGAIRKKLVELQS